MSRRRYARMFHAEPTAIASLARISPAARRRHLEEQLHKRPMWAIARYYGLTKSQLKAILEYTAPAPGPVGPHDLWARLPIDFARRMQAVARARAAQRQQIGAHQNARPDNGCAAGPGVSS